jgi:hypothetical protein
MLDRFHPEFQCVTGFLPIPMLDRFPSDFSG